MKKFKFSTAAYIALYAVLIGSFFNIGWDKMIESVAQTPNWLNTLVILFAVLAILSFFFDKESK